MTTLHKWVNVLLSTETEEFEVYMAYDTRCSLKFNNIDSAMEYAFALAEKETPRLPIKYWIEEPREVDHDEMMQAAEHYRIGALYK
jgi:hypothetical protein